jgi:pimeloyl-ACP methyl ester carboxylesterase
MLGCGAPPTMNFGAGLGPAPKLSIACTDRPSDAYTLPSNIPSFDASHRGDVFRCASTESLTADSVNSLLVGFAYKGPKLPSGFWTWRVAYRTERATAASVSGPIEGDTPAVLLVPDHPLKGAPLVVWAHGSVGLPASCAPSLRDLTTPATGGQPDFAVNMYELAGYGYTVIAPDYSGFAYGQPPGYFSADDEAHSVLDATRAAAKLLPAAMLSDKVVLVGHSQGGHAVLAAQALAAKGDFGLQGTLVGVAAYAPFWSSFATYAALATFSASQFGFNTDNDAYQYLFAMDYFYSSGELLDGPGHGVDVFQSDKQTAVAHVLTGACTDAAGLKMLGNIGYDFFDHTFADDVGSTCALGTDCSSALSTKWLARWQSDRPPLDSNGAKVVIWYGGNDIYVTPQFAQCARDKIHSDGADAQVSYCWDAGADHLSLIRIDSDYVNQWIAARAGIGAEPAPCTPFPTTLNCPTAPRNL